MKDYPDYILLFPPSNQLIYLIKPFLKLQQLDYSFVYPPRLFKILKYTIKANPFPNGNGFAFNLFGDSYENRTRVTAVKGRCLNRLTKEP